MLSGKQDAKYIDDAPDSDDAIKAKMDENDDFIRTLESGNVHLGAPFEGRAEAKIHDLKRQNAIWQLILDKRHADRT